MRYNLRKRGHLNSRGGNRFEGFVCSLTERESSLSLPPRAEGCRVGGRKKGKQRGGGRDL